MSLHELRESLRLNEECYRELLDLAQQKKESIVNDRLNDLTLIMTKESRLLKKIAEAEQMRTQAILSFQQAAGLQREKPLTLTEVARIATNPEDKKDIRMRIERLSELTGKLKEMNELNQSLTRQALDFVELSLDLLMGVPDEAVYRIPTQAPAPTGRKGAYDFKA